MSLPPAVRRVPAHGSVLAVLDRARARRGRVQLLLLGRVGSGGRGGGHRRVLLSPGLRESEPVQGRTEHRAPLQTGRLRSALWLGAREPVCELSRSLVTANELAVARSMSLTRWLVRVSSILITVTLGSCDCGAGPEVADAWSDPMDAPTDAQDTQPRDALTGDSPITCVGRMPEPTRVTCRSDDDCNGSECNALIAGGLCIDCEDDSECPMGHSCVEYSVFRYCATPCKTDADCTGVLQECRREPPARTPHCGPRLNCEACGCPAPYGCGSLCYRPGCGGGRTCPPGWTCDDGVSCVEPG